MVGSILIFILLFIIFIIMLCGLLGYFKEEEKNGIIISIISILLLIFIGNAYVSTDKVLYSVHSVYKIHIGANKYGNVTTVETSNGRYIFTNSYPNTFDVYIVEGKSELLAYRRLRKNKIMSYIVDTNDNIHCEYILKINKYDYDNIVR